MVSEPVPETMPETVVVLAPSRLKLALKAPSARAFVLLSVKPPLEPPAERKTVSPVSVMAPERVAFRTAAEPSTRMVPAALMALASVTLPPEKASVAPWRTKTVPAEVPRLAVLLTHSVP